MVAIAPLSRRHRVLKRERWGGHDMLPQNESCGGRAVHVSMGLRPKPRFLAALGTSRRAAAVSPLPFGLRGTRPSSPATSASSTRSPTSSGTHDRNGRSTVERQNYHGTGSIPRTGFGFTSTSRLWGRATFRNASRARLLRSTWTHDKKQYRDLCKAGLT